MITRPSDGAAPKKVAWLQCIGSRDQVHPYCSSICCMYATKEALLAKQRDKLAGNVKFTFQPAEEGPGADGQEARIGDRPLL